MKIDFLFSSPGFVAVDERQRRIESIVQSDGLKFFRLTLYMTFKVGNVAEGVEIDEAPRLEATFAPATYDLLAEGSPVTAAQSTGQDELLIVEMDTVKQVEKVVFSSSAVTGTLEFYRLDGNIPSDKSTANISVNNGVAILPAEGDNAFADIRFGLRLKKSDNTPLPLKIGSLSQLKVLSCPTGPRLGLSDQAQTSRPVFFWQKPGELRSEILIRSTDKRGVNETPADDEFRKLRGIKTITDPEMGKRMKDEIRLLIDAAMAKRKDNLSKDAQAVIPDHIDLAFVVESDAPCNFSIKSLSIDYKLVLESFVPPAEKQVLRFTGKGTTSEQVALRVPSKARIESAVIRVVESFNEDRPVVAGAEFTLPGSLDSKAGAYNDTEHWVAQVTTPSTCQSFSGIMLGLMTLSDGAALQVEIQDDLNDQPSGHKLTSGSLSMAEIGLPDWVTLLFPQPVVIPTQPHWVLIRASKGNAVWLSRDSSNAARIVQGGGQIKAGQTIAALDGKEMLLYLISRNPGNVQEQGRPASSVYLGGTPIAAKKNQPGDPREFDFTSALQDFVTRARGDMSVVPLTFSSGLAGIVTVYPPRLEFSMLPSPK